jgi:alpha-tubulin suppressor-like RCC1 family protein
VVQTDLGFRISASLTSSGQLFMSGSNSWGQLGDGSNSTRRIPVNITSRFNLAGNEKITLVRLGDEHAAAISSTGRLWTWGINASGRLGDGTTINKNTPTEITSSFNLSGDEKIVNVSLSNYFDGGHSAAYTSSNRVFTWGKNFWGQLGDNTSTDRLVPTEITSRFTFLENETISDIQSGNVHQALLTSTGRVFVWGFNGNGQLGDGSASQGRKIPFNLTPSFNLVGNEKITSIHLSLSVSLAVTSNHRLFIWGSYAADLHTPFGITAQQTSPLDVTSSLGFTNNDPIKSIQFGFSHAGILSQSGKVFMWGNNANGRIGNGDAALQTVTTPTNITNGFNLRSSEEIIKLELGDTHSSAVTNQGRQFVWGERTVASTSGSRNPDSNVPFDITSFLSTN